MDFIQDHQLALLGTHVAVGVVEPEAVGWALEIQVNAAVRPACGNLSCQRGFADLTGAEQDDGRHMCQFLANAFFCMADYHH